MFSVIAYTRFHGKAIPVHSFTPCCRDQAQTGQSHRTGRKQLWKDGPKNSTLCRPLDYMTTSGNLIPKLMTEPTTPV